MSNRLTWCQDGYLTEKQGEYISLLEAKLVEYQKRLSGCAPVEKPERRLNSKEMSDLFDSFYSK